MDEPEILLRTRRFDVVRVRYRTDDGTVHEREVARHPGAVTVLPLVAPDRVCLIRNFRVAVGQTLVELPAGTLEPGEDPAATARRELEEETGYRADTIDKLCEFFMSPGILSERMIVFLATDLTAGPARLEGGELIEPFVVSWGEAMSLIERGEIRDSKSIAALLWYDRFGRR
ncbi:MAG TPA: NUDIX hydrolase [Pirellulales bacterium]|nr:NUDIX hydrolase [Pirellulales bacterium]